MRDPLAAEARAPRAPEAQAVVPPPGLSWTPAGVLELQRRVGNAQVARVLARQPDTQWANEHPRHHQVDPGGFSDDELWQIAIGEGPEDVDMPVSVALGAMLARQMERQEQDERKAADDDLNLGPLLPAGLQLEEAAALREVYRKGTQAILDEANIMRKAGVPEAQVADWVVKARNSLKEQIRNQGARIIKVLAEARNVRKYNGNPLGPSAEDMRAKGKTNTQIIEGVTKTDPAANRWTGRMRIAGRIFIALDIGIGIFNVASAPEVDRPRVLMREIGRIGGGVGGAVGGAKLGGLAGAWAGPIGIGVGAVIGGILGAFVGSEVGSRLGDFVADQFYPPEQTGFEGDFVYE